MNVWRSLERSERWVIEKFHGVHNKSLKLSHPRFKNERLTEIFSNFVLTNLRTSRIF